MRVICFTHVIWYYHLTELHVYGGSDGINIRRLVQTLFFVWNVWSNILCRTCCNRISPWIYGRRESSLTAGVWTSLKTILTMLFQKYGFEKKNIFYGENLISFKCHWSELLVIDGENKTINYLARLLVS